jgi:hypothetical protein
MAKFRFRERIPIDVPHTLMQLLSRFQGVRDGLPELIKNAKDQYSRLGVFDPAVRAIVVVVNTAERSIGVIDFAGAPADQFKRWEKWSDPTANTKDRAADIEGGHGNSGKAFMVLGSTTDSSFESCYEGRRTRMGYENDTESTRFKPGIAIENGKAVEAQLVENARKQLDRSIAELGLKFGDLPKAAQEVFNARQAFTVAQVNGVKEWSKAREETIRRSISELRAAVETHPQAALTLESCGVWFVIDGQLAGDEPAKVRYPEPFRGFADPLSVPVPEEVTDPQTGEPVSTGAHDDGKVLILRTSAKSLRTEDMRPLHVIRVRNARNVVGIWSVANLCPGASSGFVFGEVRVPALHGERFVDGDVGSVNSRALLRSLEAWVREGVDDVAERIHLRIGHTKEERDSVNACLSQMRDVMSELLRKKARVGRSGVMRTRL